MAITKKQMQGWKRRLDSMHDKLATLYAEVADAAGDGAAVTNAVGDAMLGMEDACTTLAAEMTSQVIPQGRKTARDEARGRHPGMGDPETDDEPPATNRRLA